MENTILTNKQTNKQTAFILYLRAFSVLSILLCHLVQANPSSYVQMTAQFFNIGVELFIIISGFCFGLQGKIDDWKKWYGKRVRRIYIPYELFLLVLFALYFITGNKINIVNWISCVIGIQGATVGVLGADHTWFITAILLCYVITPVLSEISEKLKEQNIYLAVGAGVIPIMLSFIPAIVFHTIGSKICLYVVAFILGKKYREGYRFEKRNFLMYMILFALALGIRMAGRSLFDGSRIYECIIVGYTQCAAAFCIMAIFAVLFYDVGNNKIINRICENSFEVYLYHYMFVVGPVSLMHLTGSWLVNSICVLIVTWGVGVIMRKLAKGLFMGK